MLTEEAAVVEAVEEVAVEAEGPEEAEAEVGAEASNEPRRSNIHSLLVPSLHCFSGLCDRRSTLFNTTTHVRILITLMCICMLCNVRNARR